MAATAINRKGYGQVQPNHLSAQYTGQIYAQLPAMTAGINGAADTPIAQLENGQFLKYNYAAGRAGVDGDVEWMLVYNEEKLYDERRQNHKDFAMIASEMADKTIYPRLLKINIGDIFTTNTFGSAASGPDAPVTSGVSLEAGNYLTVSNAGWLTKAENKPGSGMAFQVVKVYNLADEQPAVKIQRIQ